MDLEDAAALSACARVERQRLEAQHERNSLVAAARWCLAMRRSQSRSGAAAASMCTRKERGRERVVCTLDRRARVEHYSASRGEIPCHAGRGEGSASGGSLSFVRAAAAASGRVGSGRQGKTDCPLGVAVCPFRSRKKFAFGSAICQLYFFYSRLLISC